MTRWPSMRGRTFLLGWQAYLICGGASDVPRRQAVLRFPVAAQTAHVVLLVPDGSSPAGFSMPVSHATQRLPCTRKFALQVAETEPLTGANVYASTAASPEPTTQAPQLALSGAAAPKVFSVAV